MTKRTPGLWTISQPAGAGAYFRVVKRPVKGEPRAAAFFSCLADAERFVASDDTLAALKAMVAAVDRAKGKPATDD